jgi:predicted alpha-1,2-mannosidase
MRYPIIFTIFIVLGFACNAPEPAPENIDYVDPFIGTAGEGHTFPGAVAPWGMVAVNPVTTNAPGNDLSVYRFGSESIKGFNFINMSGSSCPAYGSLKVMPMSGAMKTSNVRSAFSEEEAEPGYYRVKLNQFNVNAELSADEHKGITRFSFPEGEAHLLFNLGEATGENAISQVGERELVGFTMQDSFCEDGRNQKVYFSIYFHEVPEQLKLLQRTRFAADSLETVNGSNVGAVASYNFNSQSDVTLTVGLSYVSIENARINQGKIESVNVVKRRTKEHWSEFINRVQVKGGTEEDKKLFYTSLYHTMIHPNIVSDRNREYTFASDSGMVTRTATGYEQFSSLFLPGSEQTLYPLLTLLYPEKQEDVLRSALAMHEFYGQLPSMSVGGFAYDYADGDPAAQVLADSYLKGLVVDDAIELYETAVSNTSIIEPGAKRPYEQVYASSGYVPYNSADTSFHGSVSSTLSYAYADWTLAQLADEKKKRFDEEVLLDRSKNYKHVYDSTVSTFRPRLADSSWLTPFNPDETNEFTVNNPGSNGFIEGSAKQYAYYAPHDVKELDYMYGGQDTLVALTNDFIDKNLMDFGIAATYPVPYYPNHFNGKEGNAQQNVLQLIRNQFSATPDGLPALDQGGTVSAWLVFSMMGIYPDALGSGQYYVGQPVFNEVQILLNNQYYPGELFTIKKKDPNSTGTIRQLYLNSYLYPKFFLKHEDLVQGGLLEMNIRQ